MNYKKLFAGIWMGLIAIGLIYIVVDNVLRDPTFLYCVIGIPSIVIFVLITAWAGETLTK